MRAARKKADVVVVYLHWGTEELTCPTANQTSIASTLAKAGADIVVGSHAHRVQGGGWKGSTFVEYGLGNFVWYNNSTAGSATTGVLTLSVVGRHTTKAVWAPLRIGNDGIPRRPAAKTRASMLKAWRAARSCTGLSGTP